MNYRDSGAKFLVGLLLAAGAAAASAATTWTLDNKATTQPVVSGWYAATNSAGLSSTSVGYWGDSGIGVGNEGNPEHALDNKNGFEVALLSFDKQVKLDSVTIGWAYNDSDFFVLAYTGLGSPTLPGAKLNDLTGWSLVGNYSNPGENKVSLSNPGTYSSFWLIGAGGFGSTVGVTSGDRNSTGWRSFGDSRYDYIKVAAVGGTVKTPPPGNSVPEPGTLALLGLAFAGMVGVRRRKVA